MSIPHALNPVDCLSCGLMALILLTAQSVITTPAPYTSRPVAFAPEFDGETPSMTLSAWNSVTLTPASRNTDMPWQSSQHPVKPDAEHLKYVRSKQKIGQNPRTVWPDARTFVLKCD